MNSGESMVAVLFLLMTLAIAMIYSGKRKMAITIFVIALACCCFLLFHVATNDLKINW